MKIQAVTKSEVTDRLLEILDQQQVDFLHRNLNPMLLNGLFVRRRISI